MVVSILGCGWLGKALGKYLVEKGYGVMGSVTRPEKLAALQSEGISSFQINLDGRDALESSLAFWNCDALVIASNVNLQGNYGYIDGLKRVAEIISTRGVKRVIVVSSTSLYGEPNEIVDESSILNPKTPSAECLLEIESLFQNIQRTQATMMRCGGLVGPGRMPGSFLAGKKNIANGLAPVNLIHLSDCIGIIECLLKTVDKLNCVNAVSPDHPSRFEFYTAAAKAQALPLPQFVLEKNSWKIVQSELTDKLAYSYQVNDWLRWLTDPK
jgi:nucleoside-diphosphate-sugar epimerase